MVFVDCSLSFRARLLIRSRNSSEMLKRAGLAGPPCGTRKLTTAEVSECEYCERLGHVGDNSSCVFIRFRNA